MGDFGMHIGPNRALVLDKRSVLKKEEEQQHIVISNQQRGHCTRLLFCEADVPVMTAAMTTGRPRIRLVCTIERGPGVTGPPFTALYRCGTFESLMSLPLSRSVTAVREQAVCTLPQPLIDVTFNCPELVSPVVAQQCHRADHRGCTTCCYHRQHSVCTTGYMSEILVRMSSLLQGRFTEEDRQLSDEIAELDENRMAYELRELHRPVKFQSFCVHAFDSSNTEFERICLMRCLLGQSPLRPLGTLMLLQCWKPPWMCR